KKVNLQANRTIDFENRKRPYRKITPYEFFDKVEKRVPTSLPRRLQINTQKINQRDQTLTTKQNRHLHHHPRILAPKTLLHRLLSPKKWQVARKGYKLLCSYIVIW
ncbi:MAG: hypothetical protein HY929_01360, partial [Euryarchaeota archaeon]|nr:hypothetical protein [Euryarchaeota archaeon]